jgi:hypothetical protein
MSDTPRTDNAAGDGTTVPADFAADLERELAAMTARADELHKLYDDVLDRAEKAEAEVERLWAELARLTTLRPHAGDDEYDGEKLYWGKDGDSWICDPLFVHSTHWTPLPDVKETK